MLTPFYAIIFPSPLLRCPPSPLPPSPPTPSLSRLVEQDSTRAERTVAEQFRGEGDGTGWLGGKGGTGTDSRDAERGRRMGRERESKLKWGSQ